MEPNCDSRKITKVLKQYVPRIQLESDNHPTLTYIMDTHEMRHFANIWATIWENKASFRISKYFISSRALEEAYISKMDNIKKKRGE